MLYSCCLIWFDFNCCWAFASSNGMEVTDFPTGAPVFASFCFCCIAAIWVWVPCGFCLWKIGAIPYCFQILYSCWDMVFLLRSCVACASLNLMEVTFCACCWGWACCGCATCCWAGCVFAGTWGLSLNTDATCILAFCNAESVCFPMRPSWVTPSFACTALTFSLASARSLLNASWVSLSILPVGLRSSVSWIRPIVLGPSIPSAAIFLLGSVALRKNWTVATSALYVGAAFFVSPFSSVSFLSSLAGFSSSLEFLLMSSVTS